MPRYGMINLYRWTQHCCLVRSSDNHPRLNLTGGRCGRAVPRCRWVSLAPNLEAAQPLSESAYPPAGAPRPRPGGGGCQRPGERGGDPMIRASAPAPGPAAGGLEADGERPPRAAGRDR
eukprot:753796-Hanusia_phi.AAC.7